MRYLIISLVALLLIPISSFGEEQKVAKVVIKLDFVPDPKKAIGNLNVIRIRIADESGKILYHSIRSDSPAATQPSRFKVFADGDSKSPINVTIFKRTSDTTDVQSDILLVSKKLEQSKSYTVEMLQSSNQPPGIVLNNNYAPIPKFDPIKVGSSKANDDFQKRNKALQTSFSVLGGKDGSSASVKLGYGLDTLGVGDESTTGVMRLQSSLDAEVSYKPKKNHDYINSINGEVDYVWAKFFENPQIGDVRGLFETGVSGRFESDQSFDKINLTVGWTNWMALNSPNLSKFATGLCVLGKPEANAAPILVFSYDYVTQVKDDLSTSDKGTDTGRNRLRSRFYWSIELAHDADFLIVHHYDTDFLIDVGGIYDFESSKFLPDVRLSLDIGPFSEDKVAPKFTLTFVNGKTTPTFKNYDALLAGFKLPF
jgi:hypothetical protein